MRIHISFAIQDTSRILASDIRKMSSLLRLVETKFEILKCNAAVGSPPEVMKKISGDAAQAPCMFLVVLLSNACDDVACQLRAQC